MTDLSKVIVLRSDTMEFGVLADSVGGARSIPVAEIQPSLPTLTEVREKFLKGVTKDRLVILDGERILSDESIVVHAEA
jgi:purine-binding chemotaxis protein CheW